jgi:hypothetical protein
MPTMGWTAMATSRPMKPSRPRTVLGRSGASCRTLKVISGGSWMLEEKVSAKPSRLMMNMRPNEIFFMASPFVSLR